MWFVKLIQSFANPICDAFAVFTTRIGEDSFYLIVAAVFVWCINREFALKMHFAFYMNNIANSAVKDIFAIPRHYGQMDIRTLNEVPVGGYSFPSGHVQSLTSYLSSVMLQIKRKPVTILGCLLILVMSLSRIYLGAHTPIDVIGGGFLAVCVVLGANKLYDLSSNHRFLLLLAVLAILIAGTFFMVSQRYMQAVGHITALMAAEAVNKYFKFKEAKTIFGRAAAVCVGITSLLKIESIINEFQVNEPIFYCLSGFFRSLFVLLVFPLLMSAMEFMYKKVRRL